MDQQLDTDYFGDEIATFGDRVEAGRLAAGLSQHELAHKLGVKEKTVRGWEDNISEPRANKLQMVAGLLNVSIMWLLTGEGDGVPRPADMSEDARAILSELRDTRLEIVRLAGHFEKLEQRLGRVLGHE